MYWYDPDVLVYPPCTSTEVGRTSMTLYWYTSPLYQYSILYQYRGRRTNTGGDTPKGFVPARRAPAASCTLNTPAGLTWA